MTSDLLPPWTRGRTLLRALALGSGVVLGLSWGLATPQLAYGQEVFGFSIRTWGVDDGLPQSTPTRLVVDEQGFVWGGSFGGLFRFDGASFRTFGLRELEGLGTHQVTALIPSRAGGFWIGGGAGGVLRVVDGVAVEELPRAPGQEEDTRVLLETEDGALWMWTLSQIFVFKDGAWSLVADKIMPLWPGIPLSEVSPGELIGGSAGGFFRISETGLVWLREPPFDYDQRVFTVLPGAGGVLWAGLEEGLALLTGSERFFVPGISGTVEHLARAPDGALWVAGEAGVWRLRGPGLDLPGSPDPRALRVQATPWGGARPTALTVTSDGIALVGALGAGITAITPQAGYVMTLSELWDPLVPADYGDLTAHSVTADRQGRLWVSKDCGPLIRLDAFLGGVGPTASLTPRVGMRISGCIRSLALDPEGVLWAADNRRLLRITEQGEISSVATAEILDVGGGGLQPVITAILSLSADSLLLGTSDGRLFAYGARRGLAPFAGWGAPLPGGVLSMAQAVNGQLWVGGGAGEVRYSNTPGGWEVLTREDGVPPGPIRVLHPDVDGGLWIGSYGGGVVYRTPAGRVHLLPLADATLSALLETEDGTFWIPQNTGLVTLERQTLDRIRQGVSGIPGVRRLRSVDGIPEVNNGRPAAIRLPSGRFAIGTVQGLLVVDPDRLPPVASSPVIQVDRVRTPLRDQFATSGRLELTQGERLLELDLSYPTFRASDPVRVRYRLVGQGYAGDWVITPSPRVIQLAALRPGTVRVDLETSLPGDGWTPAFSREVRVAPYFWERRAVQGGILLLLISLGFVALRGQARAQRAEAMALRERMRREADAAAVAEAQRRELSKVGRQVMAVELSASLTHEVSQPITAISQTVTALRWEMDQGPIDPHVLDETLDEVLEQSQRARDIIQGLRRFLTEGQPKGESVRMRALVEKVPDLMRHELEAGGITLRLDLPDQGPLIRGEHLLLQQVLLILVTNAIEASPGPDKKAVVRVRVRPRGGGGVRVSVSDRGLGISRGKRFNLFDPFQSTKIEGMGMGLAIARRIILAHGGQISLRSQEGRGTVSSFWVPGEQTIGRRR